MNEGQLEIWGTQNIVVISTQNEMEKLKKKKTETQSLRMYPKVII